MLQVLLNFMSDMPNHWLSVDGFLQINVLRQAATDSKEKEEAMRLKLRREAVLRKKAYNQIRELKGNIRVLARVRPAAVGAQSSLNPSSPVSLEVT